MGSGGTRLKLALGWLVVLSAAGCSLFSQVPREAEPYPTRGSGFGLFGWEWGSFLEPSPTLRPGLGPLTVWASGSNRTRISWRSPWPGKSVVRYGLEHRLLPHASRETLPSDLTTIELTHLAPGVRHFFQVETLTAMGSARSAICSFLPEPAPAARGGSRVSFAKGTQLLTDAAHPVIKGPF